MKNLFFTATFFLICLGVFAQFPGGGSPKGGQGMPNLGHVYGKLVDSAGKAISGASVIILQTKFDTTTKKSKEVLAKGMVTGNNGEFNFEELPVMGIKIKISSSGFKEFQQPIQFFDPSKQGQQPSGGMPSFDKDLGKIALKQDASQLQGVVITATGPSLRMDIDKKVFNVEKNITSAGGTAIDVMKNVPSVQVDIDGNVKLRNASPQIYVDGRPTTLSLDQIPADAIQSVEVITNPSAKYDASGGNAGILNIVLKKNKKTGYNGNVMAGIDSRGGLNGGGNFNIRQGKFNVSAAVMANQRKDQTKGVTNRNYYTGDTLTHLLQNSTTKNNGGFLFAKLGADYFVSNRSTISLSGIKVHGQFKTHDMSDIFTDSTTASETKDYFSNRFTNSSRTFNATGAQFAFVHNYAKEGEQFTLDGNYFSGHNSGSSLYNNNFYDINGNYLNTAVQQQLSGGTNKFFTAQTDYTDPIAKNTKLEAGLRAQINSLTNNNDIYSQYGGNYVKIPEQSISYHNTNNVYAAYTTITSAIKNFGYEVGLRAESSTYDGELTTTNQKFSNKYPVSLFPSVFLSQKLKNKQELQANISRRINRPNFFQILPYTDRTDSLNISRGNPDLVPEFTYSAEISYSKTFKKNNSLLASIYYKHTDNLITRFLDSEYNTSLQKTELINTYINANSSYAYGAEITSVNYVTKWWDFTANINVYNSKINTDNITASQPSIVSYFGKLNNNFKLPANFSIQLSGNYQSKTNLPVTSGGPMFGPPMGAQSSSQGYIKPFWFADIAVKKTLFKNQAGAITLSMSDIFRTRTTEQISSSSFFYQDYYRLNNPQLLRLNFSYRFGKMDFSLFKRTNAKAQAEGMQGATQGL